MIGSLALRTTFSKSITASKSAPLRIQSFTSFLIFVLASFHPVFSHGAMPGNDVHADRLDATPLHPRQDGAGHGLQNPGPGRGLRYYLE
jgi:hypothetical protein